MLNNRFILDFSLLFFFRLFLFRYSTDFFARFLFLEFFFLSQMNIAQICGQKMYTISHVWVKLEFTLQKSEWATQRCCSFHRAMSSYFDEFQKFPSKLHHLTNEVAGRPNAVFHIGKPIFLYRKLFNSELYFSKIWKCQRKTTHARRFHDIKHKHLLSWTLITFLIKAMHSVFFSSNDNVQYVGKTRAKNE